MIPAPSLSGISEDLRYYFEKGNAVRLVGILFARPEVQLVKDEILPSIEYFHHRSGESSNFYFAGYQRALDGRDNGAYEVVTSETHRWVFSPQSFNRLRADLEGKTKWHYSGATDLILLNAVRDDADRRHMSFTSAIVISLESLKHDGNIPHIGALFEQVFRYAEEHGGDDPTWGVSDALGAKTAGNGLKGLLLQALPEGVRGSIREAFHYSVKDIGA